MLQLSHKSIFQLNRQPHFEFLQGGRVYKPTPIFKSIDNTVWVSFFLYNLISKYEKKIYQPFSYFTFSSSPQIAGVIIKCCHQNFFLQSLLLFEHFECMSRYLATIFSDKF